jgi:hypothetical protein
MDPETASETLDLDSVLTRLISPEDFIAVSRRESFKSDIFIVTYKLILRNVAMVNSVCQGITVQISFLLYYCK